LNFVHKKNSKKSPFGFFLQQINFFPFFRFIRCIYNLLNSSSASVRYEAAGTLVTLSSAPTAVKAAVSAYIDLIVKESDNNVKLIVLDRLIAMKEVSSHEKILQESVMDILRVLSSPDIEVRTEIYTFSSVTGFVTF
jgi:coatomer subunit beta